MLGRQERRSTMGQEKRQMMEREQARHDAAERDGRKCPYCGAVVPYGTNFGPHGEGPECVGALRD